MLGSDTKSVQLNIGVTASAYRSIERGCDGLSRGNLFRLPFGTRDGMRDSVGVQRLGSDWEPVRDTTARRVVTRPAHDMISGAAMLAIDQR